MKPIATFQLKQVLDLEDGDFYDVQFVIDSFTDKEIKPLRRYRRNSDTKFRYDEDGLNELLFGLKKWRDFQSKQQRLASFLNNDDSGESCSDIEVDEDAGNSGRNVPNIFSRQYRSEYTKPEQFEIVAYLVTFHESFLFRFYACLRPRQHSQGLHIPFICSPGCSKTKQIMI